MVVIVWLKLVLIEDKNNHFILLKHDGRNFGIQKIIDRGVELTTSFVKWPSKNGLEWTARIGAISKNKRLELFISKYDK